MVGIPLVPLRVWRATFLPILGECSDNALQLVIELLSVARWSWDSLDQFGDLALDLTNGSLSHIEHLGTRFLVHIIIAREVLVRAIPRVRPDHGLPSFVNIAVGCRP